MFPDNISQNIDILVVIDVWKNNFGFHSNQKTQGQKHGVNNLNFKYQICQIKLRHLNTFLQIRLSFHEPHCTPLISHFAISLSAHMIRSSVRSRREADGSESGYGDVHVWIIRSEVGPPRVHHAKARHTLGNAGVRKISRRVALYWRRQKRDS